MIADNNYSIYPPDPEALPADAAEIGALAAHVRAGRCALFVGSGLSAPAGLPTWGGLMDHLVAAATPWAVPADHFAAAIHMDDPAARAIREHPVSEIRSALGPRKFDALCKTIQSKTAQAFDVYLIAEALELIRSDANDRVELQKLATQKRFPELAGACRDRLGRARFDRLVREALTPSGDLPQTHRDIVRTPYACIVTTNFDTLLETAYVTYGVDGVPRAPTGAELGKQGTLLHDGSFFILKAHGDAARPETMVFTADDYRRVIHASPAFQAVLGGILMTHAVLFAGYSLSDTNFRLLLDNQLTVFNGNVPPRYVIMEDVGAAESEVLWNTARLRVLSYPRGQHGEVARCLAALAGSSGANRARKQKGKAGSSAPSTSASALPADTVGSTLDIESDGDRLWVSLTRRRTRGRGERVWAGGTPMVDALSLGDLLRHADSRQSAWESPLDTMAIVGKELASRLPADLARALAALPPGSLVELACSASVGRLPWEWLWVRGEPLAARHAVIRRPAEITPEARGRRSVRTPLRALVIGDAGAADRGAGTMSPLAWADLEAAVIERLICNGLDGATVTRLSQKSATHARVVHELEHGDYDLIHFGGHAWFDDREAYFMLWDRLMLGSEMAPLLSRRPPALMVLDTHYTAFVLAEVDADRRERFGSQDGVARSEGRSLRGFAEPAMRAGVTAFVGAFGNVSDYSGATLSVQFYAHLLAGHIVAEALRLARFDTGRATQQMGLFYTAFGYPDFRLVTSSARSRRQSLLALAAAKRQAHWPNPK